MKVVYCNPISLDYRLPYFAELKRLFNDQFYLVYSPLRYKLYDKESLLAKIKAVLGDKAIPLSGEHLLDARSMTWDTRNLKSCRHISFLTGIGKAVDCIRPDVLITDGYFQWTPWVLLYGLMHRIPVYMAYERTPHTERHCGFLKRGIRKLLNKLFAGFLANGQETQKYLESLGVPSEKIHICGMNADAGFMRDSVKAFRESPEYEKFRCSILGSKQQDGITYIFCGYLSELKGVMPLMHAWKEHITNFPHDHLILVGNGPLEAEVRSMSKDDASVHCIGRVVYDEVPKYYAIADVSILPTTQDNWSLVIPEAMACGLPVTTSIYNGCHRDLIKEGINGYVFDTYQRDTMLKVLAQFHGDDLVSMGKASVELEHEFCAENCAARVYQTLINECGKTSPVA